MTLEELRNKFNNEFGIEKWPKTYEVDSDTYANICQGIFDYKIKDENRMYPFLIEVTVGLNNGIFFKGVELILLKTK